MITYLAMSGGLPEIAHHGRCRDKNPAGEIRRGVLSRCWHIGQNVTGARRAYLIVSF